MKILHLQLISDLENIVISRATGVGYGGIGAIATDPANRCVSIFIKLFTINLQIS